MAGWARRRREFHPLESVGFMSAHSQFIMAGREVALAMAPWIAAGTALVALAPFARFG